MFHLIWLIVLPTIWSTVSSVKIECGHSIDAAFWAHDQAPDLVYVFSDRDYYLWNISNNTIASKGVTNETWSNLPESVDAACAFRERRNDALIHIFLKGNHYWLYRDYNLRATDTLGKLFSEAIPKDPDCFTCDPIDDNLVGFTTIGRNSLGSRACTATFDGTRFGERECTFKTEGTDDNFKLAYKKAGYCKALATNFGPSGRDFIYFGTDKIAIGRKTDVRFESLEALVDCRNFFSALSDPTLIGASALIAIILLLLCIVCVACFCKYCGKKDEEDLEGDFTEKPASAPSITVTETRNNSSID